MSYVNENLISGEVVQYQARLHWTSLAARLFWSVALIAGGVALVTASAGRPDLPWLMWLGVACFATAVVVGVVARVIYNSAEFAITNKRVILKTGVLRRRSTEMFLAKVETVAVDQSLTGRLFDYGTISLVGTGGTAEPFAHIAQPLEFRRQVQEQMSHVLENRSEPAAGLVTAAATSQVP